MKQIYSVFLSIAIMTVPCGAAWAHTPFMACFDNGDATITCNGEFSDGASAAGAAITVVAQDGGVLARGCMDEDGEYTFARPQGQFTVIFDAGPGHVVKEQSDTILE